MRRRRNPYEIYAASTATAFVLASAVLYFGKWRYDPDNKLRANLATLNTEDYLANLREKTEFGCRSFIQKRPDVLLIGDSHTYSAYDFNSLSVEIGTRSVSACALGGFYIESFFIIADYMSRQHYFPKVVVLNTSPREFVDGRDKKAALSTHKFYLDAPYTVRDFVQDLITGTLGRASIEIDQNYGGQLQDISDHRDRIAAINPVAASRYIAQNQNRSFVAWTAWTANVKFTRDIPQMAADICAIIKSKGAHLLVVDIPESPTLRETIYPPEFLDRYHGLLSYFSCAELIVTKPASYYGIDDRYFLNRLMRKDFSYDKIALGEKLPIDSVGRDVDYDLDHMNLVGASRFTPKIAAILRPGIRRALDPEHN